MSISQLKTDLETAILTNNKAQVEHLLYNKFPNPEDFLQLNNTALLRSDKHFKDNQKLKLKYCFELTQLNCKSVFQNISFKNRFPFSIGAFLYRSKSIGWATGLYSTKILNIKGSADHIFRRIDMAQYYLTQNPTKMQEFIYKYRYLFGLTIKITSEQNTKLNNSITQFYKQFSFKPSIIGPYILPVVEYYYRTNKIKLIYKGSDQILFDDLRNYILKLFL